MSARKESQTPANRHIRDHYLQKGWVVVPDVFAAQDAQRMAESLLSLAEHEHGAAKAGYNLDRTPDGRLEPRKLDDAYLKDVSCRRFLKNDRLHALLSLLLGQEPLLVSDGVFFKPPRHGSAKPYHQDNFYFQCQPNDGLITAWIALDDVDAGNGCLRYIDGSHRGPILPHDVIPGEDYNSAPPPELIDLSRESLAPVPKGGVVFHHSQTLHTSHRNHSDRWRRGWATHWVTAGVTSTNGSLDEACFKRADYGAR